jgi:1-acyl-sn-glycerol-3-phosphate acyltransferase
MVMKAELGWIPLYGWFSHKFEHIFVSRDRGPAALKALIRDARARAAQAREIIIFPAGTRRPPGAPPDYKPGFIALYEGLGLALWLAGANSACSGRAAASPPSWTIVSRGADPIPAGLGAHEACRLIEERIETACASAAALPATRCRTTLLSPLLS